MDRIELQNLIDEALGMVRKKKDETKKFLQQRMSLSEVRPKSDCDLRTIEPPGGTSSSTYSTPRITTEQLLKRNNRRSIDV